MNAPVIAGFSSNTIHVNGIDLHYLLGGEPDGTPVILWHGFLGTSHSWKRVMPILADAGYAVLVPDMRGYGDSDKPEGTTGYDVRTMSEDFRKLAKQIGFGKDKPITLVAHDMGAAPALIWAADHPDEVAVLLYMEMVVMLDAILGNHLSFKREVAQSKYGPMWWWILPHAPEALELFFIGKEREFLTWFYNMVTANKNAIGEQEINEVLRTFSGRTGVNGAFGIYRGVFNSIEQTTPLMQNKVKVPIIAVGGARSLGTRVGDMVRLVAENVEVQTIEGAGHFVAEEQPEAVAKIILSVTE